MPEPTDLDPRLLKVNDDPLQLPDRDPCIRTIDVGGPRTGRDVRLSLSVAELEQLLEVARRSLTQRAVINQVGLRTYLFRTPAGHQYEVWKLIGLRPEPERSIVDQLTGGRGGSSVG